MRLSKYFLVTAKETPADAEVVSHQLMLRAGLIRKLGAGLYTWLPLGLRVLHKVENIVRQEMDRAGALEVLVPPQVPAVQWSAVVQLSPSLHEVPSGWLVAVQFTPLGTEVAWHKSERYATSSSGCTGL